MKSILAGIIDTYGGIRFVVTPRKHLKYHIRVDEVVIIVPDLTVKEPIAWGDIPMVTGRIKHEVSLWLARGEPNEPYAREAYRMYKLRQLEHTQRSLDLYSICET